MKRTPPRWRRNLEWPMFLDTRNFLCLRSRVELAQTSTVYVRMLILPRIVVRRSPTLTSRSGHASPRQPFGVPRDPLRVRCPCQQPPVTCLPLGTREKLEGDCRSLVRLNTRVRLMTRSCVET